MKRTKSILAMASGVLAGALVWAVAAPVPDSYVKFDAASLSRSPQNAWARAILFTDSIETPPGGRVQRLDRKNYLQMKLQAAGTAWIPEDLAPKFKSLQVGKTYSFAGTVDQISRRYYLIVDMCYTIQTVDDMNERWTDMLNPQSKAPSTTADDASSVSMQALLVEAQSRLVIMAQEQHLSVAQLIEAQTDGGQRIAAHIVADALQGELKTKNKTAEELMIGSVLALLQKQAVLDESAKIAAEQAIPSEPAPESVPLPAEIPTATPAVEGVAVVEEVEIAPIELPADESIEPATSDETIQEVALPPELPAEEELISSEPAETPEIPVPEMAIESVELFPVLEPAEETPPETDFESMFAALEEAAADAEIAPVSGTEEEPVVQTTEPWNDESDVEPSFMAEEAQDVPAEMLEGQTELYAEENDEQPRTAELTWPDETSADASPVASPPSSMLVVPLSETPQEIVPLVSVQPTKAELALMKKQEAAAQRELELAAQKAAAEEAARQAEADRQARIEAKRLAAAEKKAEEETRLALIAQQQAEEKRVREEAAARKIAEKKAKQAALQIEAAAKKMLEADARRLALEEKQALEAVRQAEILQKQADEVRARREAAEQRLVEMAARKEAAEAAIRSLEEQRQVALAQVQAEVEARAAQQAVEQEAQVAAEQKRQAESLRMAQEVAAHEKRMAKDASARIAEERAAREAAEAQLKQMEQDIRELDVKKKASAEPTPSELRKQEAAVRKAEVVALRKAKAAEKAKATAEAEKEMQKAIDSGTLPEWMQPMKF